MAARTAEVVFLGNVSDLKRALKEAEVATATAAEKMGASSEASAARTAAAHDKMVKSAAKTNAAFAKWGTVAAAGVIGASVDMAIHVEDAAAAIAKSAGTTSDAGKKIEDAFRKIPGTVEYSGAKIGEAFAGIAGELKTVEGHALDAGQAVKVMTAALDLADATGGDLKQTTEALGKVMLTYGLQAGEAGNASDVLFNASKATGESVETFTTTLDKARGRLGALAPSVTETAALMAELAKQGVAGRLTMGSLAGVFGTLVSQSKPVTQTLKDLNVHVFNSKHEFVGLHSVIEQLHPAMGRLNQESQLQAARLLFGEKAAKQMLEVIHQGPAAFDQWTKKVGESGTASRAAGIEHETLAGKAKAARATLENTAAGIGDKLIPALQKMADALKGGIDWLDKHKTAAKVLAGVITGILAAAVIDFAVIKVAKFVKGVQAMTAVIVTGSPWLLAIAAAGAAAYELSQHWTESMDAIEAATESAANAVVGLLNELIDKVNHFTSAISFGLIPAIGKLGEVRIGRAGEGKPVEVTTTPGFEAFPTGKASNTAGGIMAYFMSKGLSAQAAAGIVGNVQQESNFDPKAPGGGLFQYTGSRAASGKGTALQQLEATWTELNTHYKGVLAKLKKAHSPAEAAAIFEAEFEKPEPGSRGKREAYAQQAYGSHSHKLSTKQTEEVHAKAMEKHAKAIEHAGTGTLPGEKAKPDTAAINRWAEEHVGKFRESTGKNTGPELDALQKEFHTRAAAWCAEFATTAAMMGGANKAVRTASVATIREWAEAGTHGYRKGVSKTPHVGDLMMFGNSHVGFVQSVHGDKVTTIEGNTSGGKVEVEHRTAGEGTYATPIYRSGGAGSVIREGEASSIQKRLENAVKQAQDRAERLVLSAAQRAGLHVGVQGAGEAHAVREQYAGAASSIGTFLQARQAKWALDKPDLTTAGGQKAARDRDWQAVDTAKTEKKYYERELRAIRAEAKNWGKVRDSYLKLARHQHGGAKKEALHKAAEFDAKFKQAQADAAALGETIASTETAILEGEHTLNVTLPEEIAQAQQTAQSNDLGAYQAANSKVDAELRAGLLTEDQAKAAKIANAQKALSGGYGALSEEGILQVKGDLKEFSEALTQATNAVEAHTKALEESARVLKEFNQESQGIAQIESGVLAKGLADLVSGQIGGRPQVRGAGRGAPSGSAARY